MRSAGKMHMVKEGTLEQPDRDGFFKPRCYCGARLGAYPGVEDAADALMQHAREQGYLESRRNKEQT